MASNRKVQRLLNEFMDLLSEYGGAETNQDSKIPNQPKPVLPAPAQADLALPMTEQTDPNPQATDQKDISQPAAVEADDSGVMTEKAKSDPSKTDKTQVLPAEDAGS